MNDEYEEQLPNATKKKAKIDSESLLRLATEWFPKDRTKRIENAVNIKRLLNILIPIALIFVTLLLLVHSSVMLADAEREYENLRTETSRLNDEIEYLRNKLTVKNDILKIEDIARNELGMVGEAYLNQHYIPSTSEEGVDAFGSKKNESVIASLLGAFKK